MRSSFAAAIATLGLMLLSSASEKPARLTAASDLELAGNYAVVIGVNQYADDRISTLNFAETDAAAFSAALTQQCCYPADHVYTLLGQEATTRSILRRVAALADDKLFPEIDTVVFYFSGHGMAMDGENYVVPFDGTVEEALARKANLALSEIIAPLKRNSRTQVVFLDACRSNAQAGIKGGEAGLVMPGLAQQQQSGLCVMFGSEPGQVSREDALLGHGLFSFALLEGLRGAAGDANGTVTIGDLSKYVASYMQRYSQAHPERRQLPYVYGDYSPLITLAVNVFPTGAEGRIQAAGKPQVVTCRHRLLKLGDTNQLEITMNLDPTLPRFSHYRLYLRQEQVDAGESLTVDWRLSMKMILQFNNRQQPYSIEIEDISLPDKSKGQPAPHVDWRIDVEQQLCILTLPLGKETRKLNYAVALHTAP